MGVETLRSDSDSVITALDQITPSWLTGVLLRAGESLGRVVEIGLDAGETSFCLKAHLRPVYEDPPGPPRLFVKFTKPQRPVSTPDDGREVLFYQHVAVPTHALAIVRCYDAVFDSEHHRMHVVLEDVSESHYAEPPSHLPFRSDHAGAVVDTLSQIHAAWWERPPFEISNQPWPNPTEIEQRIARVQAQVGEFLGMLGDRLSAERHQLIRRALGSLPRLYRRLLDPTGYTVIHDDVHVGNVLYPRAPTPDTIRLIDWQTWHVDLAAKDLAHMMAVVWYPDTRSRLELPLLKRYHRGLVQAGVRSYSWDRLWFDYRLCVLRKLFLPPHLWATGHTPNIWWNHLQRILLAFDDLGCADLLDD